MTNFVLSSVRYFKKGHTMNYEIDKSLWSTCKVCGKTLSEIKKEIGGENVYFSYAFKEHIASHRITLENYFYNLLKIEEKICPCGICGQRCGITLKGAKIYYKKIMCGRNNGVKKWSERARTERKGSNNPMFGKASWNKGLTRETSEVLKKIGDNRKGSITSKETKKKQSESAKKRTVHGHTGKPHSQETKDFLRDNTLKLIKAGVFKQTKSKPHIKMSELLSSLEVKYEEEKRVSHFSFDFYLPDHDIYIEVDGDYFHSNPKIYPNGPKTKTQKINSVNDSKKNTLMSNKKLFRFWESDILNEPERILCKLKELCQLNQ